MKIKGIHAQRSYIYQRLIQILKRVMEIVSNIQTQDQKQREHNRNGERIASTTKYTNYNHSIISSLHRIQPMTREQR